MSTPRFPGGVWAVDFEFHPANGKEGNLPIPVCLVASDINTGRTLKIWQDELLSMSKAPFPTDETALFVAYYASAEIGCFLALGWELPVNILDLYIEFRCVTNGKNWNDKSLLGALTYFALPSISSVDKEKMRALVLRGIGWNSQEQLEILDYCESDVSSLGALLPEMVPSIDWPRALLRGQYSIAAAKIERTGVPLDLEILNQLRTDWGQIETKLVAAIDSSFGVFEGTSFRAAKFKQYLISKGISWPHLPSGSLDLKDETFKIMAGVYPELMPLHQLRKTLSQMRLEALQVGEDGQNRYLLSMFSSKTGRNQPSSTKAIFGNASWLRCLIKPRPGYGLAYIDWSQQEFGIAAALSGDLAMQSAYLSGDPYLAFAKQANAVPAEATKKSHQKEREQFKACVLAVQYGMGEESLAYRIGQPVARARQLLQLHKKTYRQYWKWSDDVLNEAQLGGRLWTVFGWPLHTASDANVRSIGNFPMQANGAEMLRIACIRLAEENISVCAPVHDALLIEAPLDELDAAIERAQQIMREVSRVVLNGFALESDVKIIRYPDRYVDERGVAMWNTVMNLLGLNQHFV